MKKTIISFLIISALSNIFSFERKTSDFSKGPLYGKTTYIPYMIYYNFYGQRATCGEKFQFEYHLSLYLTNDFLLEYLGFDQNNNVSSTIRARDYESLNVELGASYYILKNLQVGLNLRIISYYGGFLDPVIEGFHHIFGFPNGGREYVNQYLTYVNIENKNNVTLTLNQNTVSFGDIDLWVKYTFFQRKWIALAGLGAFKIPSGQLAKLSGSGSPDFALGILADFKPVWIISFYLQAGLVVPFDSFITAIPTNPYPMFNGLIGVELNPTHFFSLVVQFNIKTSPLEDTETPYSNSDNLSLPQVNTLVGCIFRYKGFKWQFYVEEDSFTNAGVDICFNLMFAHSFKFNKRF